ncbi:MAG TPA: nitroreductase family protein [Pseudonocardiaceae bacterium]|nr:nitroreductase family protein [Pseudonocardiaceae bacterium]
MTDLTCIELLTTTRSVRAGLDLTRDVDLDLVKTCLRIALQAPNGTNQQRWRWIVLTDPDLRAKVADIYREAFYARNQAALDGADSIDPAAAKILRSARDLAEKLHLVPVLVIPCLELDDPRLPDGNQAGLWGSLLPAAWSYALAARAHGLATTWTTVHLAREWRVGRLLGLPQTVRQGALLPTAHPLRTRFRPATRRPLDDVLHVNGWHPEADR